MPDAMQCDTCPANGPIREILAAQGATLKLILGEVDKVEDRIIDRVEEKLQPVREQLVKHDERLHEVETTQATSAGRAGAHGAIRNVIWGFICAIAGGVVSALAGHSVAN